MAPPTNGAPGRIAYKTGTSYGYRDAWAIGFDGKTVIGVWVGRPDGASVPGMTGFTAAAPLLFESFDRLGAPTVPLKGPPQGRDPDGQCATARAAAAFPPSQSGR